MSRATSRRGLVIAALLLLIMLVVADVLRPNSILRDFFGAAPANRQQERLEGVQRRTRPLLPKRMGVVIPGKTTAEQQSRSV